MFWCNKFFLKKIAAELSASKRKDFFSGPQEKFFEIFQFCLNDQLKGMHVELFSLPHSTFMYWAIIMTTLHNLSN